MKQDAGRGRPLLTAAMELLTDLPTQVIVSAFRSKAGDPGEAESTAHYQGVIWRALRPGLQDGRLVAIGFAAGAEVPKAIHPQFFDGATPDLIRSTLTSHGVTYTAVRIFETAPEPAALTVAANTKGKGGRKPVHDWAAFTKEVVRFAWEGCFTTRRELTAHMRDWCSSLWQNPPDDETIRKEVVKLCPDDIPAE